MACHELALRQADESGVSTQGAVTERLALCKVSVYTNGLVGLERQLHYLRSVADLTDGCVTAAQLCQLQLAVLPSNINVDAASRPKPANGPIAPAGRQGRQQADFARVALCLLFLAIPGH